MTATAYWHDGQVESQANRRAMIRVREHEDGRTVVYGWCSSQWQHERDVHAGFLVRGRDAIVAAIHVVGESIGHDELAGECIGNLPAEDGDTAECGSVELGSSVEV